jgi:hypothetical protein
MLDGIFRCRREFEREHGISLQEVLDSMKPAHPDLPTVGGTPGVGCLIMVARKP